MKNIYTLCILLVCSLSSFATLPPITGPDVVCAGYTIDLDNAVPGGTWTATYYGYGAWINATTGELTGNGAATVEVTYTAPSLEFVTKTITINPNPIRYKLYGNGTICDGSCITLTTLGAQAGVEYQVYEGATLVGGTVCGSATTGYFPVYTQCADGVHVFNATATYTATGCMTALPGSATTKIGHTPTPVSVTADDGGKYCGRPYNTTSHIRTNTSQPGVRYELRGSNLYSTVYGNGGPLDLGTPNVHAYYQSGPLNYISRPFNIIAYDTTIPTCMLTMSDHPTVEWLATPQLQNNLIICTGDTVSPYGLIMIEPSNSPHDASTMYYEIEDPSVAVAYASTQFRAVGTGYTTFRLIMPSNGCVSNSKIITVTPTPSAAFTVNDISQDLAGNLFTFTSTPAISNKHLWSFGDGLIVDPLYENVTNHSYIAPGVYTVRHIQYNSLSSLHQRTCESTATRVVNVLSDDVGGSGGGEGGLESESLGGLVSLRDFNRIKNSKDRHTDYTKTLPFTEIAQQGIAAKNTTQTAGRLAGLVPAELNATTTAVVTTPQDITTITKAVDAFALDYIADNKPKAVVLAITTLDKPYSHTKSVCDRFKGSTLLHTETVKIHGFDFIRFALQQQDGTLEFCIAFDAGKSAGRNTIDLQTSWLIGQYKGDDSVFNFQAWAADPDNTVTLTDKILSKLETLMPLRQTDTAFAIPPAYIASGKRIKGNLELTITNRTSATNAEIRFEERLNEHADVHDKIIPILLAPGGENKVNIPINDGYEYPGYLYLNGVLTDAVYLADGNWSLDYDKNYTSVSEYETQNDPDRVYTDNEYPIYRTLSVKAKSTDYMMAYKFITSGNKPVDISGHRSLKFHAKGVGRVQVMLTKESINKFKEQYYTYVTLDPNGKDYAISFADFASDKGKQGFTANDVTAVVFTWNFGGKETQLDFTASKLAFSPEEVVSYKQLKTKSLSVYPNPSTGTFDLSFQSEDISAYDITIMDIAGRLVHKERIMATQGANKIKVSLPQQIARPANLIVTMGNEHTIYSATKLFVTE